VVLRADYVDEQCLHCAVILCSLCKDHVTIITGFFLQYIFGSLCRLRIVCKTWSFNNPVSCVINCHCDRSAKT